MWYVSYWDLVLGLGISLHSLPSWLSITRNTVIKKKKSARVCVDFSKWTCVKTSDNHILLSSLGLLLCWWTCKRKHVSVLTDCRCSSVTLARGYRSWLLRLISLLRETKRDRESETAEAPYTLSGTEPWSVSLETPVFTQLFPAKMAVVNGRQCSCVQ